MNYTKYERTFVILEAADPVLSEPVQSPKGSLKIETGNKKGAMLCTLQHMPYRSSFSLPFQLVMSGSTEFEKGTGFRTVLGGLNITRSGNGDSYFRFDPLNVDGKGHALHDYTRVDVCISTETDGRRTLRPLLTGKLPMTDSTATSGQAVPAADPISRQNPVDDQVATSASEQTDPEMAPKTDAGASAGAASSEDAPQTAGINPFTPAQPRNYNRFYNEHLLHFCRHTCKVFGYYRDVHPFRDDVTGAVWKHMVNVGTLPLVSPGAHHFANHYRHYLFGTAPASVGSAIDSCNYTPELCPDSSNGAPTGRRSPSPCSASPAYYYFAIPGKNTPAEQPDGGRSGFTLWQPMDIDPERGLSYGYWILAVDAKTGDILSLS